MKPPKEIPQEFAQRFTMAGLIGVEDWYLDDTVTWPIVYDAAMKEKILLGLQGGDSMGYGLTGHWLWECWQSHPIQGLDVMILGSRQAGFECGCHLAGAKSVITVDYNPPEVRGIEWLTSYGPAQWEREGRPVDAIVSISSIEHSGLGRYGDSIDPSGDLDAMRWIDRWLKADGTLYLSVPLSDEDWLVWNAHRIYGPVRTPMLLDGWRRVTTVGGTGHGTKYVQPVMMLQPDRAPNVAVDATARCAGSQPE